MSQIRVTVQEYFDWASSNSPGRDEGKSAKYAELSIDLENGDLEFCIDRGGGIKREFLFTLADYNVRKLYEVLKEHFEE